MQTASSPVSSGRRRVMSPAGHDEQQPDRVAELARRHQQRRGALADVQRGADGVQQRLGVVQVGDRHRAGHGHQPDQAGRQLTGRRDPPGQSAAGRARHQFTGSRVSTPAHYPPRPTATDCLIGNSLAEATIPRACRAGVASAATGSARFGGASRLTACRRPLPARSSRSPRLTGSRPPRWPTATACGGAGSRARPSRTRRCITGPRASFWPCSRRTRTSATGAGASWRCAEPAGWPPRSTPGHRALSGAVRRDRRDGVRAARGGRAYCGDREAETRGRRRCAGWRASARRSTASAGATPTS